MKTKFAFTLITLGALALGPAVWPKGAPLKKGQDDGGGGNPPKASKPSRGGGQQPNAAKPSGGGARQPRVSKPSGGGAQKPSKPSGGGSGSYRPSGGGAKPPVSKPSGGGSRLPEVKHVSQPQKKPQHPSGSGAGVPSSISGDKSPHSKRPSTPPASRPPSVGGAKPKVPDKRPDSRSDFLGLNPDKSHRPTTSPGHVADGKPNRPTTLPAHTSDGRPNRPTTLPAHTSDGRPNRPTTLPAHTSDGRPNRPTTLPGSIGNRPGAGSIDRPRHPIADYRPGKPQRPARPDRPEKWQSVQRTNVNQWNSWRQDNSTHINNFQVNRSGSWNDINRHSHERGWASRYGSDEYRGWHRNVYDFRRHRGEEIWHDRRGYWNDCFDYDWWDSCWWRRRPIIGIGVNLSPWWWWRPFTWASYGAFYGAAYASEPSYYDPGASVIYEGDTYYVNGQPSGSAVAARRAAIQLATPVVDEIPVPEPVAEGQAEAWLPLGVWALTQQEQGDATMFMQLSVDKDGIVAGAYKNVMTGDEQPIIGQLDRKTQRIAWHVGDATQTVYETGIAGFENDVVSVFVHFGEEQTQTWLLVHLPSPEIPPGTVKLPELAKR